MMPKTKAVFQNIWDVDQTWMPDIRSLCHQAEEAGKHVCRLLTIEQLDRFDSTFLKTS